MAGDNVIKKEFIDYNNSHTRVLYNSLLDKYDSDLTVKFDESKTLNAVKINFLNSEVLHITVGARPAGKTEWYVEIFYRGKSRGHAHFLDNEIYDYIQKEFEELNQMVRSFPKMEFIGRNNGFALAMDNHINLIRVFLYTSPLYFVALVSFIFNIIGLGLISFAFPTFFLLISFLALTFKNLEEKFLEGNKKEHIFTIENAILLRDNKEVKDITNFTIYKYKKFLHIKTSKTFYVIREEDCIGFEFRLLKEWFLLRGANVKIGI